MTRELRDVAFVGSPAGTFDVALASMNRQNMRKSWPADPTQVCFIHSFMSRAISGTKLSKSPKK